MLYSKTSFFGGLAMMMMANCDRFERGGGGVGVFAQGLWHRDNSTRREKEGKKKRYRHVN